MYVIKIDGEYLNLGDGIVPRQPQATKFTDDQRAELKDLPSLIPGGRWVKVTPRREA